MGNPKDVRHSHSDICVSLVNWRWKHIVLFLLCGCNYIWIWIWQWIIVYSMFVLLLELFKLWIYYFLLFSFTGDGEPVKVFDRTANLANNQIINYRCDPSEKWLVLIGIAPGNPEVSVSFPIATFHALHFDLSVIPLISICVCSVDLLPVLHSHHNMLYSKIIFQYLWWVHVFVMYVGSL